MGRKKNKSSKHKGPKNSSAKNNQNGGCGKPEVEPNPTSQSHDGDVSDVSVSQNGADDCTTASNVLNTTESYNVDDLPSESTEPSGRLSRREEFARTRSFSSSQRSSNEGDEPSINQTESFSVNVSLDTAGARVPVDRQDSAASTELTEEALSMHQQLLQATPSTSGAMGAKTEQLGVPFPPRDHSPQNAAAAKRASMQSHEDCESGVGTFSVQSESSRRGEDDTFAEQEVHPMIHSETDLDIQATEMHQMAENMMYLRDQSRSASNVSDLHMDSRLNSRQNSSVTKDDLSSRNKDFKYEEDLEEGSNDDENLINENNDEQLNSPETGNRDIPTHDRVEGKPPSGNLQRQGSSSTSATELSRTQQLSHTGSATSDFIMSGTMPQGLTSSDLTSSKTGAYSTMSASRTSTGMAYHSTYHSEGTDFGLTTSNSIQEEADDLSQMSDNTHNTHSRDASDAVDGLGDHLDTQSDHHEIRSTTSGAISTVGELPDILSPTSAATGSHVIVRASLEDAEDVDRRMSLDYDLGSSIESMAFTNAIKFSNPGRIVILIFMSQKYSMSVSIMYIKLLTHFKGKFTMKVKHNCYTNVFFLSIPQMEPHLFGDVND